MMVRMARWEPNATLRLVNAAVALFTEQGYDATTVNEIAERAGLTKTTFFRHFTDKREVLFAGQEIHGRLMTEAIAASPDGATPLEAVRAALDALTATFPDERREFSAQIRAIIADNGELQERSVFKRVHLATAMADALRKRGVPDPTASLAAELGSRAFYQAFGEWADPAAGRQTTLADLARRALEELRAAATTLG
jgi:AcrR family transcriptional regulator